jgi:hypothetical protein
MRRNRSFPSGGDLSRPETGLEDSPSRTGAMAIGHGIRRYLPVVVAVAAAASTLSLAPTASAKGVVLPRESCTGPEIANKSCEKPPQPVPTHMFTPHGSRHRKMELAAARKANSTSEVSQWIPAVPTGIGSLWPVSATAPAAVSPPATETATADDSAPTASREIETSRVDNAAAGPRLATRPRPAVTASAPDFAKPPGQPSTPRSTVGDPSSTGRRPHDVSHRGAGVPTSPPATASGAAPKGTRASTHGSSDNHSPGGVDGS